MALQKKRILVDARMVKLQGHGIGNYVLDLANAYMQATRTEDFPFELHFLLGANSPSYGVWQSLSCSRSQVPFLSKKEIMGLAPEIRRLNPAVFHSPSFASLFSYPCRFIQTVHDLNHLYFGSFSQKLYYKTLLRASLWRADAICSVSRTSQSELAEWLNIPKSKITLVPNGIPELNFVPLNAESYAELGLKPGQYFICLATTKPHKRLSFLLSVYEGYRKSSNSPWPLLLTVAPEEIAGQPQEGVICLPKEEDERLDAWIAGAACLVFPSVYEGFGRPPLEALLQGTATIVSDIAIMREVMPTSESDHIRFVGKDRMEPWVDALKRIEQSKVTAVPESLKQGILQKWSTEEMWRAQIDVYQRVSKQCSGS